jgi:DNA-binding transcriptional MocR family regulator
MNIPGDEFYTLLHAALKKRGDETLQRALYLALREAILSGKLQSGSQLSGSRTLAQQLAVSRNTVNAALDQLTLEGYLLRNRQGTRVAQFAHRARVRTLPAPEVRLAKRVTICLRRCSVILRSWHLRRERPPSTISLAAVAAIVRSRPARGGNACLGMAIRPESRRFVRRLLATSRSRVLTATPAR